MTIFLALKGKTIVIKVRVEELDVIIGDTELFIGPYDPLFLGISYEEMLKHTPVKLEINA